MDRYLKERLVGAAVLVAAAIVLIPEMLSGPHDATPALELANKTPADTSAVKTYTIDLSAPQTLEQHPAAPAAVESAASPPLEQQLEAQSNSPPNSQPASPVAGERDSTNEPSATRAAHDRDVRVLEEFTAEKQSGNVDKPPVAAIPATVKPKPESTNTALKEGAWAVQVASFSVRATSERIAAELKSNGYAAFVTSFVAKGQTMYRVRVGPVADRAAAEALLKKIKPLHAGAAVVPQ